MISFYQIFLAGVAAFFITASLKSFFRTRRPAPLLSLLASLSIFVFAIYPDIAHLVSETLGMGENLNTLIFTGFVIMTAALIYLSGRIDSLERDLTRSVRGESIREFNRSKDK
ncbi:DUF2304 family protein [bacterium]|nr:DUF2304 family protein [bacterium]MCI0680411.1 DUF2304 family protein [bacterium]